MIADSARLSDIKGMFREKDIRDLTLNPFTQIGRQWMLISAGDKNGFNTMTASWGGLGFMWNKPAAFVFVRPSRYTYEFIERNDMLTLSFFDEKYRDALKICGSKSGRDCDKIAEAKLTPHFTELGNPTFEEAGEVFECRKMYAQMLTEDSFIDKSAVKTWYPDHSYHKMYVLEILHTYGAL